MWHQTFSDNLRIMDFKQCKADYDLWIRDCKDHYEYIAVMVDDILVFSKEPESIIKYIKDIYGYELNGVGSPEYYSGADITYMGNTGHMALTILAKVEFLCFVFTIVDPLGQSPRFLCSS